ncbi:hypothetical protein LSTR_LSTR007046 [Laodelphax striatellus]|uniref:FP protein C-terminal domain-containing protein n=1 Tax=Laodelphax striatellus TaxID=195883 RepID=A0A482WJN3_LAOST|nr:hypothetical protein LSTR_LSTR007046 [Laodelphax striatellus]
MQLDLRDNCDDVITVNKFSSDVQTSEPACAVGTRQYGSTSGTHIGGKLSKQYKYRWRDIQPPRCIKATVLLSQKHGSSIALYKYVWFKAGKIFIRKAENCPAIIVTARDKIKEMSEEAPRENPVIAAPGVTADAGNLNSVSMMIKSSDSSNDDKIVELEGFASKKRMIMDADDHGKQLEFKLIKKQKLDVSVKIFKGRAEKQRTTNRIMTGYGWLEPDAPEGELEPPSPITKDKKAFQ